MRYSRCLHKRGRWHRRWGHTSAFGRIRDGLSDQEFFARLGGDEFAIIQHGQEQAGAASHLAERIIASLHRTMEIGDLSVHLGSSIGIALFPSNAIDAEDLHKKADLALYRAKAEGRGTYRFFDNAMDERLLRRRRLEADLRMADDFGTGYSSLAYFRTFPFDQVKIDQSFVSGLTRSGEALAIVKAIIGLGKGLGMSIVAEGVETREQMVQGTRLLHRPTRSDWRL